MATIRFRDLVKRFGKPEIKSLWTAPEKDAAFMRAVKQNRVLTLSQKSGGTDFGEIGFHETAHAAYLIFQKPLKVDAGAKVIGVKYDLIEEPEVRDPVPREEIETKKPKRPRPAPRVEKKAEAKPLRHFQVKIRKVATLEISIEVDASNKKDAVKAALEIANQQSFDSSGSKVVTKAVGCKSRPSPEKS